MKAYMQRMGRSLMLPVAVLPAAAILMGIANWVGNGDPNVNVFTIFMFNAGDAILSHLAVLFAVGLALGMSKDKDGSAALAGLVAYLVPEKLLSPASIQTIQGLDDVSAVAAAFTKTQNNVLIGIIAGLVAAAMYNRFSDVKLPMALSFFSGKRLVPIMSAVSMVVASAILYFAWPVIYNVLVTFGTGISSLGFVGAGLYGFFNRLLIPTGLHHALNSVFWFDVAGINDIGNFLGGQKALDSGLAVVGKTGMYQAGFFPVMMFGLPAGAFAMYRAARPEKKKVTASLMMAAGFAAFFTGVTEPLEFSFMFVAWPLYVLHAVFTGLSLAISAFFQWTAGFAFSAGFVDYFLALKNPVANQPLMLVVQGLVFAAIYYFGFTFAIKKFNLMTPGREEGIDEVTEDVASSSEGKHAVMAQRIYAGLGGSENVTAIDNCTTRLRLQVKDTDTVDQAKIKATGVPGINVIDKKNIQVIVGTEVQFVADEMSRIHTGAPKATAVVEEVKEVIVTGPQTHVVYAVANGQVVPITDVSDKVFSQKMMGDGFAVLPTTGEIFTPVAGTILNIFPTKHAMGIQTTSGVEVLLHMGIDTVSLKGEPFELYVEDGQQVARGQLIAKVDLEMIQAAGRHTDMIVVFTNPDNIASLTIEAGINEANAIIGSVESK
ncbi:N-acetylglucosamine-specific PTS transporter subunit IIBC [Enterococcus saccharolyticus]|uniref:PTS system, N-acetylglucosamine-specific IIBC component n=1 Tax=Enterococcus saccharolyticus subsp. saccharolyticus ATCC 43076 TaxID=1139996 RepID=S0J0I0_9ENTE|nr:N-acetylglucosamine-specific PTS transporter subunit IIBC [Enterococcus saccharolyticus]EOT26309.1 PTS system, N-acetylglucosamine-specific IIBC component [Enterococcus saccharolyticus subsp. saccharolyticus ATCC 43076]EOT76269.1 PTS system, N-acetylglucosamine-specific IIBC component [Enterococcus saccharolyticus subsp. saccharolyticus ATCC 43076]OJG85236.1 PTS system, N-acetylglucosamine-specific IIBC component [Enterococcus saccharolyticus]